MEYPKSLAEAAVKFADPAYALEVMVQLRWPEGPICPVCESKRYSFLTTRSLWKCLDCKKQYSVKAGSIFEDSALPLGKWLLAIWLVANAKNGISSYELHRSIGVSQKSAWFMAHRIRLAMQSKTFAKLSGTVEADETFVGGKARGYNRDTRKGIRGGTKHLTPVMGILQRGGDVIAFPIDKVTKATVQTHVRANVEPGSTLYTDGFPGYRGMSEFNHDFVSHYSEFVRGDVHSNNIECFWNLFKRSIRGTWIRPTPKHLFRYLDDQTYRWNYRKANDLGRFLASASQVAGQRITYRELIGKA